MSIDWGFEFPRFFLRREFACRCGCGFDTVDYQLILILKDIRLHFGLPMIITSGCRCESHNKAVGGGEKSQHLFGRAADFRISGISPSEIYDYILDKWPNRWGVGVYNGWVHIDSRETAARWDERHAGSN
jgi:uncharacterized protein YcbK (DUF882 family)